MLGFKNEKFLRTASSIMNFLRKIQIINWIKTKYGKETPFNENDLTTDIKRYKRI
jgi:hypothetical protein